ncbi:MAG TPA: DUF167 family protein [Candidatus Eremiobacteraceae bacterium]
MVSALLVVAVKPGSKAPGIVISGETVTVRVREPAVEGRATEAARRAVAAALRVPQSAVTLVRGATSRHKSFAVARMTKDEVLKRLAEDQLQ